MWGKARKKPIVIEYREAKALVWTFYPRSGEPVMGEVIKTREGELCAIPEIDFIIKGVRGEIYPIGKDIFFETYEVIEEVQGSSTTAKRDKE